jgi:heptosyltransferase-3/putative inorganic carbon (HCO3(-)) transporter
MVMAIPLVIAAGIYMRTKWRRLIAASGVVVALAGQVFSYTRAGWLGMVVQGMVFGLLTARRKLVLCVFGGSVVIGIGLMVASQAGFHLDTVDLWTLEVRLAAWHAGILQVLDSPLVGIGYGNSTFNPMIIGYPGGDRPTGLHNTFLMVAVGSGLPALIFLVWVFVQMLRTLIVQAGKTSDAGECALLLGVAILVVGFGVRNFFDYMFMGSLAHLFWIAVAMGMSVGSGLIRVDSSTKIKVGELY